MNKSNYIISGGESGAIRLKILFDTLLNDTLRLLELADIVNAQNILDIGCGAGDITSIVAKTATNSIIDAYDFDESILDIARKKNSQFDNINFRNFDINSELPEINKYDTIISRFLLSHLTNPNHTLEKFYKSLRSNGKVIIEDVDFEGHFCYPPNSSYSNFVRFYTDISIKRGMDPLIGRKLYSLATDSGFEVVHFEVTNPTFHSGIGKLMGILTFKNIAQSILNEGLTSQSELDYMINDLEEFTSRKDTIISMPRIFRVIGVKSF